tara:strand:+ start:6953 stop:8137 length:1185 start_codon:yes stop_codon:yes gene_type:complete
MTSFHLLPELSPKEHVDNIADTIEIVSNELEDIVPMANDYIIKNCCNKPNTFNCYYNNPSKPVAFVKLLRKDEREFDILLKLSELKLSEKPLNSGLIYYKTYPNIKDGIVGDEVRQSWESTSTVSRSSENNFRVRHLNYVAVIMPWAVDCNQKVIKNNRNDAELRKKVVIGIIDVILKLWEYGLYYLDIKPENFLYYDEQVVGADFGSICTEDIINKSQFDGQWPVTYNVISDKGNPNMTSYFFITLIFHLLKTWSDIYFPNDTIVYNAMSISMVDIDNLRNKIGKTIASSAETPGAQNMKGHKTWNTLINYLIRWMQNSKEDNNATICSESKRAIGMIRELKRAMKKENETIIINKVKIKPQPPTKKKQEKRGKINPKEVFQVSEKHKLSLKF